MTGKYLLAIDEGTSSCRAVVYDCRTRVVASAQQEFAQHFPRPGWVEHDPEAIWAATTAVLSKALQKARATPAEIIAIGITNQRETTFIWDRKTGQPVYNAIVWQDRRTAAICERFREQGVEQDVIQRTGLRLDPYFSATKIAWLLANVEGVRQRAEEGKLAFGTADTFLVWRLTGGKVHATDASNASRTLLFNIHEQRWDPELLALFDIPESLLPEVRDCVSDFGSTDTSLFASAIPIGGIAGDQQAALIGQAGVTDGITKSTYGTGCFVLANTGATALTSRHQLLTTVASRLGGKVTYGLEGSVFVAGSAIQWLRDELGIVLHAADTEKIAAENGVVDDVHVVPAFAGLGAPWWDPHARGAILGLTHGSGRADIITATLQSIAYQTVDLIRAMRDDGISPSVIRVDGGMAANNWFLQFLADVLDLPVERPVNIESTVLGAAYLAALSAGVLGAIDELTALWQSERIFTPVMSNDQRSSLLAGWTNAVSRVRSG
ncbi:MAG TPA: glycerol kinase GlpK [Woeseiaceae bacterium]|nr:glycerol kinase GlpK [Woeseiaceae bacterium]